MAKRWSFRTGLQDVKLEQRPAPVWSVDDVVSTYTTLAGHSGEGGDGDTTERGKGDGRGENDRMYTMGDLMEARKESARWITSPLHTYGGEAALNEV